MKLCECGCGKPTPLARDNNATMGYVKGQPMRFRKGHRPATRCKYRVQRRPSGGVRAVHIVIAERAIGRDLPAAAEVHHVDGDTRNNANTNLVICEDGAYHKLLHARARVVRAGGNPNTERICDRCRQLKAFSEFSKCSRQSNGLQTRCRSCSIETSRLRRQKGSANVAA
jgi:hypothetical protein